jgi:hypothetical protein
MGVGEREEEQGKGMSATRGGKESALQLLYCFSPCVSQFFNDVI